MGSSNTALNSSEAEVERQLVGAWGEQQVAEWLVREKGWQIVACRSVLAVESEAREQRQNTQTDIDIIARDAGTGVWHFVEVKTRTVREAVKRVGMYDDHAPEQAVTSAKLRRMLRAAEKYLIQQGLCVEICVDVAAVRVVMPKGGDEKRVVSIDYYEDVGR